MVLSREKTFVTNGLNWEGSGFVVGKCNDNGNEKT